MCEKGPNQAVDAVTRIFEMTGKMPCELVRDYNPPPEEVRLDVVKGRVPMRPGISVTLSI